MDLDKEELEVTKKKKEKTADKMFEDLGYTKIEQLDKVRIVYRHKKHKKNILFFTLNNRIGKESSNNIGVLGMYEWFTMQELKAINKKVEELGWNE